MIIFNQKEINHSIILNKSIEDIGWLVENTFGTISDVTICDENDIIQYAPYIPSRGNEGAVYSYGSIEYVNEIADTLNRIYKLFVDIRRSKTYLFFEDEDLLNEIPSDYIYSAGLRPCATSYYDSTTKEYVDVYSPRDPRAKKYILREFKAVQ